MLFTMQVKFGVFNANRVGHSKELEAWQKAVEAWDQSNSVTSPTAWKNYKEIVVKFPETSSLLNLPLDATGKLANDLIGQLSEECKTGRNYSNIIYYKASLLCDVLKIDKMRLLELTKTKDDNLPYLISNLFSGYYTNPKDYPDRIFVKEKLKAIQDIKNQPTD